MYNTTCHAQTDIHIEVTNRLLGTLVRVLITTCSGTCCEGIVGIAQLIEQRTENPRVITRDQAIL